MDAVDALDSSDFSDLDLDLKILTGILSSDLDVRARGRVREANISRTSALNSSKSSVCLVVNSPHFSPYARCLHDSKATRCQMCELSFGGPTGLMSVFSSGTFFVRGVSPSSLPSLLIFYRSFPEVRL